VRERRSSSRVSRWILTVNLLVAERGQVEKDSKQNPTQIWPYLCGFFLTPFPTSVPTSVFPFFPILIVEENVCNTWVDLLGSSGLVCFNTKSTLTEGKKFEVS